MMYGKQRWLRNALLLAAMAAAVPILTSYNTAMAADTATWQPAGWGGGGLYWAAVFHPTLPEVIYMGGDVAGIYKTEDSGKHWRLINNGLTNYAIYSLAIATKDPETVFALTTNGLCKSTDGGAHWRLLPQTPKNKLGIVAKRNDSIRAVAVDPANSNIVYAGTPAGMIFKSTDGGETWQQTYTPQAKGAVYTVAVSPRNPAVVLAASGGEGLLVSRDSGATWKPATAPKDAVSVAASSSDPNMFYAAFAKEGVYRSIDAGQTWTPCGAGIDAKAKPVEIVVHPTDPQNVYCIAASGWSGRVYSSSDGGKTWSENHKMQADYVANPTLAGEPPQKNGAFDLSKPTNLAISPADPNRLFIAANWRPCISINSGKTWQESDRGADISVVYDIRFSGPRTYVGVMDEGVLRTDDQGASWSQIYPRVYNPVISGHAWRVAVWNNNGADRILSASSPWDKPADITVISEDGGKTYKPAGTGLPEKRPTVETMWGQGYLRALAPDPNNPKIVYAGVDGDSNATNTGGGIFKSIDGGATWQALPNQPPSRRMFFALAVDPTDSKRLYWGTCGKDGGLYRSNDGGASWTKVFTKESWVFNMLVTKDGTIYCPGNNLWRSTDHGQTWEQLTHYTDGRQGIGLEIDPRDSKTLWLSRITWGEEAQGHVVKTSDGGKNWTDITGNLPYCKPLILRFNPATNELWAGGVGLFKLKQ